MKITVKIQGKEVQADLLNPRVAREFEDEFNGVLREIKESNKEERGSDAIRRQCQSIIDFVTNIFGEESAKEVFGEETDLLTCMNVLIEMQSLYKTQVNYLIKEKAQSLKQMLEEAE